ncbi:hypothetical protein EI94DRAFT_1797375 [Lactarius quietus]|nr:hypothetical protein EI94DRAFT_1797375 [Lactarius quietus]
MLDERRRRDVPLFEDVQNTQELPPPIPPALVGEYEEPPLVMEGERACIDFTLMPESDEEIRRVANYPQSPVLVN